MLLFILIFTMVFLLLHSRPDKDDVEYFYIRQYNKWQTFFKDVTKCKADTLRKELLKLDVDSYFKEGYDLFERTKLTQRKMCYQNPRTKEILFSFNI